VGGGSIVSTVKRMQQTVFEILGIGEDEAREKFGFLLDALNMARLRMRPRLRSGSPGYADDGIDVYS